MAKGPYFTTLDDAELDKLGLLYREYTLLRDNASSKVKGWIRGNTKTGPVLEVAVSYHQGRYGIEIMINSSFGDGTRSWVMIVNGMNKYVTEMTEKFKRTTSTTLETAQGNLLLTEDRNRHVNADDFFSDGYVTLSLA